MIERAQITGLVLAGGRGSRMGGTDKGLQPLHGEPMAVHTMRRLGSQTGALLLNANRNLDAYAAVGAPFGAAVVTDPQIAGVPAFAGPLAGMLAGLDRCTTTWMVTSPCDTPFLPADVVARLAAALDAERADMAIPVTIDASGRRQVQPAFLLMPVSARDDLRAYLTQGGRKIETWAAGHRLVEVPFDDATAFANINTLDDLRAFEAP